MTRNLEDGIWKQERVVGGRMKWLRKLSQPGTPGMVVIEVWIYALAAIGVAIAYVVSRF